jgi:phage terminase large subunit
LARRSEIVIADFNPTSEFWLESWIKYYDDSEIILSNYMDNPYLPETERKRIIKRAEMDMNFRRIHIDCEYGISEGLVFEKWDQIDEMPDINRRLGMDFGYTNDPTTLIDVRIDKDNLFLDELIYRTNLTNPEIVSTMKQSGVKPGYDEIIADSAEPKSIEEIYRAGFNVRPSVKGPDSIRAGIDRIKQYNIHITKRSTNLIKEFRNYTWVTDKEGKPTNKPIDGFNHGIDAIRYALTLPPKTNNFVL